MSGTRLSPDADHKHHPGSLSGGSARSVRETKTGPAPAGTDSKRGASPRRGPDALSAPMRRPARRRARLSPNEPSTNGALVTRLTLSWRGVPRVKLSGGPQTWVALGFVGGR